jgi:predicted nucleic acid-binding protein
VIVVDSSAIAEMLLQGPRAHLVLEHVLAPAADLHAPHLIDLEVASVLRRTVAARRARDIDAARALALLLDLPIGRHAHDALLPRIWQLRTNLTPYDAVYVALAETLDAPLLTLDERIREAPGHRARILHLAR